MPGLYTTPTKRTRIIVALEGGKCPSEVAAEFGVDVTTVRRRWQKHLQGKNAYYNSPKSGQPRALQGSGYDAFIKAAGDGDFEDVPKLLQDMDTHISKTTARKYLHENGLVARTMLTVPLIKKENAEKRLQWAKDHRRFTKRYWTRVWFSDEKKFNRIGLDGCRTF